MFRSSSTEMHPRARASSLQQPNFPPSHERKGFRVNLDPKKPLTSPIWIHIASGCRIGLAAASTDENDAFLSHGSLRINGFASLVRGCNRHEVALATPDGEAGFSNNERKSTCPNDPRVGDIHRGPPTGFGGFWQE